MKSLVVLAAILSLASCQKDTVPANPPEPAPTQETAPESDARADESAADDGATKAWAEMSFDEKKKHMQREVMPVMKAAFTEHDAEKFGTFNCVTCHGKGAKEGRFEMPSADLPKLPANGAFQSLFEGEDAAITQFMIEAAVPKMAATLGTEPYNPETHQGFGCYACHMAE